MAFRCSNDDGPPSPFPPSGDHSNRYDDDDDDEVLLGFPARNRFSNRYHPTSRQTPREWKYFLVTGAQLDISYNVTSMEQSHVILVITEGDQGFNGWLEDDSDPNFILWKPIYGAGDIGLSIAKSARYHVAVGNLGSHIVEVELQIGIRSLLYDPTNAYYKCTISAGTCAMKINLTGGNSALLAFSDQNLLSEFVMDIGKYKTHLRLSYGPRWITYLSFTGGVIILISLVTRCLNKTQSTSQVESRPKENIELQDAPMIPRKDDDVASLGSSYDSLLQDSDDHDYDNDSGSSGLLRMLVAVITH